MDWRAPKAPRAHQGAAQSVDWVFVMTQQTTSPLVGIGVTLRNRAEYLPEALDSLLSQTYSRVQFVLVDDGSTDGTEAIAHAYAARDRRVRYIRFPERRGMVAAWQAA